MDLFRIRDFRWLFLSTNVSRLGTNFTTGALMVLVALSSHGSPQAQAEIMAATLAPTAFFGWAAGVYADRLDKKTSMVMADIARMIFIASVFFAHAFTLLLVLAFFVNLLNPLYDSAFRALLPIVVGEGDDYMRANALMQSAKNFLEVVGYGLGGVFIALIGTRPAFLFDALTFLASAAFVSLIRTHFARKLSGEGKRPTFIQDLVEGARTIFRLPVPRALITQIGIVCLPIGVYNSLLILILPDVYHVSAKLFPYFLAVQGLSMTLGGLYFAKYPNRFSKRHLINLGLVASGVAGVLFTLVPNAFEGAAVYFLLGLGNIVFLVPFITWFRGSLPADVRGRGVAAYSSISSLMMFIGTLIAGPIGGAVGVGKAVLLASLGFIAVGLLGYLARATRERHEPSLAETAQGA